MPVIPQKEIRNNVGEILRRAEAGEEFTVTVSGRPVARLGPIPEEAPTWVDIGELADLFAMPADTDFLRDIEWFRDEPPDDLWDEAREDS